jgi:protein involved in polysaccharide export with SLBB domain
MLASVVFRAWFGATLLTCAIFSGETLNAQDKQNSVPSAPGTTRGNSSVSVTPDEPYRIGPQDLLQIDVWREFEITSVQVRPDGNISLPWLNDVQAAGLTAMGLADSIRKGLTKYLTNPQVTVTVSQIARMRQVPPPSKVTPLQVIPQYKLLPPNRGGPCDPELKQKCCVA